MRIAIDIHYDGDMEPGVYDEVVADVVVEVQDCFGYINDSPWKVSRILAAPTRVLWTDKGR